MKVKRCSKLLIKLGVILITVSALLAITVTPVMADQSDPDNTPTVEFDIYRNLLESGDKCLLIYANIPYAAEPDAPVSEAFTWRLIGTDGTTEHGSTVGFVYQSGGYGYNVYSMYFTASDNFTWDTEYTVRLSGNPAVFDDPPVYNYTLSTSDYTSLTTQDDNQVALAAKIILLATDLNIRWGLTSTTYLTTEMEVGTVLSIQGEAVFRGCLYGCQGLAPAVFRYLLDDISATERTWDEEYSGNVSSQWAGTWIETAQTGGGDLFGADYDILSIILVMAACVAIVFANLKVGNDLWAGFIDAAVILVMAGSLALYDFGFLGLFAAICWLYVSAKMWGMVR